VCPECGLSFNYPWKVSDEVLGRLVQPRRRAHHHGLLLTCCVFKGTLSKRIFMDRPGTLEVDGDDGQP